MTHTYPDPLNDGKSFVYLMRHCGDDLSVVNDALVEDDGTEDRTLTPKQERLLKFLIDAHPKHTSPMRGVTFTFRVKAPLFICRQWWKHVVSSSHVQDHLQWNEKSLRYTEAGSSEDFYVPSYLRHQEKRANQHAAPEVIGQQIAYREAMKKSYAAYSDLLEAGVCREQARGVLPSGFYTTFTWTTSLLAMLNFLELRLNHTAQVEAQAYANAIYGEVKDIVPLTLKYWFEKEKLTLEAVASLGK
jgi:thymidylate synthase (FAD)